MLPRKIAVKRENVTGSLINQFIADESEKWRVPRRGAHKTESESEGKCSATGTR